MEEIIFENTLEYIRWLREKKKSKISKEERRSTNEIIHKEYHLWRWKIKRILLEEKIIERVFDWKTVLDVFDPAIDDILKDTNLAYKSEFKERLKSQRSSLIEHHTKYLEIHGEDETIWMSSSEHRYLHNRLRREGECNIPSEELTKISHRATSRTEKCKKYMSEIYKRESYKICKSQYCKAYIMRIPFIEILMPNIRFREEIIYNVKTDTLTISSGFSADKKMCSTSHTDIKLKTLLYTVYYR